MRSRQDAAERHRSLAFGEARVAADAIGYQPSPPKLRRIAALEHG